jgi:vitamin B12 transporter
MRPLAKGLRRPGKQKAKENEMRSNSILTVLICFLILMPPPAAGQEELELEPVVVTASRIEEPLAVAPGSITVITEEEIEFQQAVTVSELLKNLPGVYLQEQGTLGEEAKVRLRGSNYNHNLILIDGVKVNNPYDGSYDFADLLVDNIERIELVRGAQSALYGSEAIGGVINIITKKGKEETKVTSRSEAGSFETYHQLISLNGGREDLDYSFSLSRLDSEGQFENDRVWVNKFSSQLGLEIKEGASLQLITHFTKSRKELAVDFNYILSGLNKVPTFTFDQNNSLERKSICQSLAYNHLLFSWWDLRVQSSIVKGAYKFDNPEDEGLSYPSTTNFADIDSNRITANLQNTFTISARDTIIAGVEFEREEVVFEQFSNILPPDILPISFDRERDNKAFYLQNNLDWADFWYLRAGVRIDDNANLEKIVISPRISTSFHLLTNTKLRMGYGKGFRAPSFRELYFPIIGNLDLEPEFSENYEGGIEQSILSEKVSLEATYFHIDFSDLVSQDQITYKFINIDKAKSWGIESKLTIKPLAQLIIEANHTYLEAKDKKTNEELPWRPKNHYNIGCNYRWRDRVSLNLNLNIVGSQSEPEPGQFIGPDGELRTGRTAGYTRLDLAGSYKVLRYSDLVDEFNVFLKLDNILDEEYFEVMGFSAPGFNFLAGLKVVL